MVEDPFGAPPFSIRKRTKCVVGVNYPPMRFTGQEIAAQTKSFGNLRDVSLCTFSDQSKLTNFAKLQRI